MSDLAATNCGGGCSCDDGLSCYCAAVAETMVSAVATTTDAAVVEMIVSGLSFYYSAAEEMVSAVEITTDVAASKSCFSKKGYR